MNVLRGKANSYSLAEDMIFNNGLHKRWFRKSSDDTSPRCVVGALFDIASPLAIEQMSELSHVIGQAWSVTHWNDQPCRRKADVCEALLAAASLSMDGEEAS